MVTQFPSLNFHHSSLITHHSNFHIHLLSSSNFYHSIFFTLFMDPTTVTVSNHFCFVTRVQFSSPSVFLFFLFPLPLQPCLSPKAETQTHKNFTKPPRLISSIITGEQRPSLRHVQRRDLAVVTHFPVAPTSNNNNVTDFPILSRTISSVVTHFPATPTSNNNNVIDFPILSWTISSDPRRCYFIP